MLYRPILLLPTLLLSLTAAYADDKPDFSGTWKLNLEKSKTSDGSPITFYKEFIQDIDHKEPNLQITEKIKDSQPGQDRTVVWKLKTDGKETEVDVAGSPAKMAATWDGKRLVTHIHSDSQGWDVVRKSALAPDGKTITADFEVSQGGGGQKATEIWEKQ